MKQQQNNDRKRRTRTLINCGGLLQKSGLLEAFHITLGDDLQDYENFPKASRLLGFLVESFESHSFDEFNFERWEALGQRYLRTN